MHFIIANIPENFHSPDLRNFFSEFIEKEAFNCFHFRHRPQSHLVNILKNSSHDLPDGKAPRGEGVGTESKSGDGCHNSESAQITVDSDSKTSHPQSSELSGEVECNDRRTKACRIRGGDSDRAAAQAESSSSDHDPSSCVDGRLSERTGTVESETNAPTDSNTGAEGGEDASDASRTHWLSSGLAGLASLISEKKQQVKPSDKWSHSAQESAARTSSKTKGIQNVAKGDYSSEGGNTTREQSSSSLEEVFSSLEEKASRRTCCVVDVKDDLEETFIRKYDRKHWLSRSGDILPQRCYLLRVDFKGTTQADEGYRTRQELSALSLVSSSPQDLLEFRPPPIMPQGNVGTPTHHFRELIRTCQMPGTLIKKLGLEFQRGKRKRRFGQVPFDYGTSVLASQEDSKGQRETGIAFTATGHLIPSSADFEEQQKRRRRERKKGTLLKGPGMELEEEREDGAEVEEWERYEPFHEDVTSQDRIKERRYEEELEVVWEKGGSGLVFYTDAQFWRAQQGDFDEQTADEWDVDMSVYYEEGAGDKDARDGVEMINSDKLRSGRLAPSVFGRRKEEEKASTRGKRERRKHIGPTPPPTIGRFEAHTRGFGRRLMEAQGWQEGQGLGAGSAGMPYALEGDGQHPHDRKGFGYHGEKLQVWASTSSTSSTTTPRPPHRHHRISTIFDRAEDADPPVPPLRTQEPTKLTHRPR